VRRTIKLKILIRLFILVGLFIALVRFDIAAAQDSSPEGPVYIVQAGDSLWGIAQRFGVSVNELARANGITDAAQLNIGTALVIPGLEGINGVLLTEEMPFGETLRSLSRRTQIPQNMLAQLNHLTSPDELFVGANVIVTQQEEESNPGGRIALSSGQSLFELAVLQNGNLWELRADNDLEAIWSALPGDVLRSAYTNGDGPGALPPDVIDVNLKDVPLIQGKTLVVAIDASQDLGLQGMLFDRPLNFFLNDDSNYVSLQGIYALQEPGFYPLTIAGKRVDGSVFSFTQQIYVRDGGYPYDPPLTVDEETIDPAITGPEDEQWFSLASGLTPDKAWNGIFTNPSPWPLDTGFPSMYGSRRSYNGSAYDRFHTGLDMYGDTTTDIFAAASGKVVFAGPLIVRGNAVMIDHGWGVYTGYMHMSQIDVQVGDNVEAGQILGKVGGTGRVSGPHLHFEVLVNGVQVDPLDWLVQAFP